jgi:hypothetical protein
MAWERKLYDVGDGKFKTLSEIAKHTGYKEHSVQTMLCTESAKVIWNKKKGDQAFYLRKTKKKFEVEPGLLKTVDEISEHTGYTIKSTYKLIQRHGAEKVWKRTYISCKPRTLRKNYYIGNNVFKTVNEIAEHTGYALSTTYKLLRKYSPEEVWDMRKG